MWWEEREGFLRCFPIKPDHIIISLGESLLCKVQNHSHKFLSRLILKGFPLVLLIICLSSNTLFVENQKIFCGFRMLLPGLQRMTKVELNIRAHFTWMDSPLQLSDVYWLVCCRLWPQFVASLWRQARAFIMCVCQCVHLTDRAQREHGRQETGAAWKSEGNKADDYSAPKIPSILVSPSTVRRQFTHEDVIMTTLWIVITH